MTTEWPREVEAMTGILKAMFPDELWDEGHPQRTAERFIAYLAEYRVSEIPLFSVTLFADKQPQLITVFDIQFSSICKHHLLPFFGVVHVGYIPKKATIGLSKLPRLVDHLATRPQTQEDLTAEIVKWLDWELQPQGVMVVIQSRHTCMSCRGVRKVGATMTTSLPKGMLFSSSEARQEFLCLLQQRNS